MPEGCCGGEVKEAALGRAVDTGVVRAYQRSDRLKKSNPDTAVGCVSKELAVYCQNSPTHGRVYEPLRQ